MKFGGDVALKPLSNQKFGQFDMTELDRQKQWSIATVVRCIHDMLKMCERVSIVLRILLVFFIQQSKNFVYITCKIKKDKENSCSAIEKDECTHGNGILYII